MKKPQRTRGALVLTRSSQLATFGPSLLIENMDKRKPVGRTVEEIEAVFALFPVAGMSFYLAHARAGDPTMSVAFALATHFRERVGQMHVSEVDAASRHRPMTFIRVKFFQRIAHLLPDVPVILESVVADVAAAATEVRLAAEALVVGTLQTVG